MEINKYIDYTNLKAYSTKEDIEKLCREAIKYNFVAVCINPYYVKITKEMLKDTNIKVCTVVGFPLGQNSTETKLFEAKQVLEYGADEIDMVINIAALKDENYEYVEQEIRMIREVTKDKILKVIIEVCFLDSEEIIKITEICSKLSVDFIKTSTGFASKELDEHKVDLIFNNKYGITEVKVSGGIKTYDALKYYIDKSAKRIGTSNGTKIMEEIDYEII